MEAGRKLGECFSYPDKGRLDNGDSSGSRDKWTKLGSILEVKCTEVAERLDLGYEGQG